MSITGDRKVKFNKEVVVTEWELKIRDKYCGSFCCDSKCYQNNDRDCEDSSNFVTSHQIEIQKAVMEVEVNCMRATLGDNKKEVLNTRGIL